MKTATIPVMSSEVSISVTLTWVSDLDHQNEVDEFPECSFFTEIEAIEVIHILQSVGLCFLRP